LSRYHCEITALSLLNDSKPLARKRI